MDVSGSYWLGLSHINSKDSGPEWTDASHYNYENWESVGDSKGKCAMIKRHEEVKVPFTGSNGAAWKMSEEGNIIKVERDSDGYTFENSRSENFITFLANPSIIA
jgi:hypothetical protein